MGSSPLARGLRAPLLILRLRSGIIPARAGFTQPGAGYKPGDKDHPRSRGVYYGRNNGKFRIAGSSPLARGLQSSVGLVYRPTGIIPARAGFTRRFLHVRARGQDHPRSRGVYSAFDPVDNPGGSSPLARGLRILISGPRSRPRIIPARAGFTKENQRGGGRKQDHPRSRGVYRLTVSAPRAGAGSSPLARGLHEMVEAAHAQIRIIPARAGFTSAGRPGRRRAADHPRSRGVYKRSSGRRGGRGGSSPLARGLQRPYRRRIHGRRIIPARAGFTPG